MIDYSTIQVYEDYFLYSGIVLWLLFMLQAAPNFFLSDTNNTTADTDTANTQWKWKWKKLFRNSHRYFYFLIAIGYTAHSGSIFPIILYLLYIYLQRQYQLQCAKYIHYSWDKDTLIGTGGV